MIIDIQRLRNDVKDHYGTAAFKGFSAAMMDVVKVDSLSDEELLEYAVKKRISVNGTTHVP